MGDPRERVSELISCFSGESADVAWLLCDRHPYDAVALTVVAEDLSARNVTFGELQELSTRYALALRASVCAQGTGWPR
jgi:acetyl-CoA synthetase